MSDCPNQKYSVSLKPRANKCNIVGQQLPTLLDVTCCVRLYILLHVVGCCWELLCSFARSNVAGGHLGLIVIYLFKEYARNTTTEAPSTSIRFCLKTEIFFSGLAYRQHISVENGHRKRIFSKTLSRMNIFENAFYTQMTWYHNQQMD